MMTAHADTPDDGRGELLISSADTKCAFADLLVGPEGSTMVEINAPYEQGVATIDGDNAYANLKWPDGTETATTEVKTGEIEWITLPTDSAKGLVRIRLERMPTRRSRAPWKRPSARLERGRRRVSPWGS